MSQATSAARAAASGAGDPCGGIIPTRTLRTTFSQTSGAAAMLAVSMLSSAETPVFSGRCDR